MTVALQREFALVGLSHKTAPIAVRERLAVPESELSTLLSELRGVKGVDEGMVVSTCNRVEAYVFGHPEAVEGVRTFLVARAGSEARAALYSRIGADAVAHLFRVAASLDSMVVGEPQILGQVKDAYGAAQRAGAVGASLSQMCQAAFAAAKRVRSETAIGVAPVSMASAGVELARKIFGHLDGKLILLVGAGKMSELTARQLSPGTSKILVANRSLERAEGLAARVNGSARTFAELPPLLVQADIVISSTAAPEPILTVAMVAAALKARRYRPLFIIDLAVPRDVEEGVGRLENVYAYNVDDLACVVQEGKHSRQSEAEKAEAILRHEIDKFLQARAVRSAVPVLATLRARAEEIARTEAQKTLSQFGEAITPKQKESIEAMGRAIVNKLLHPPTQKLKEAGKAGPDDAAALALVVAELFNLHPEDVRADGETSSKPAEGTNAAAGGSRDPDAS